VSFDTTRVAIEERKVLLAKDLGPDNRNATDSDIQELLENISLIDVSTID
jgi:hypothetical protein